jgi:hypothetical protein
VRPTARKIIRELLEADDARSVLETIPDERLTESARRVKRARLAARDFLQESPIERAQNAWAARATRP